MREITRKWHNDVITAYQTSMFQDLVYPNHITSESVKVFSLENKDGELLEPLRGYLASKEINGSDNVDFTIDCIKKWSSVYQGGNMWSALPSYLEACRDVLKLDKLDCWEKYRAWEDCAKYGGFRVMHKEFCIVCEFPEKLQADVNGRPHCATGPSHRWKTGFELYHLNGVRVPKWLVMTPAHEIDVNLALSEKNADVQREIIRKIGAQRFLVETKAKELDNFIDQTGFSYRLLNMKIGNNINRKYLYFEHASLKGVWYAKPVPPECRTALHARAWILGLIEREHLSKDIDDAKIIECLPDKVA